MRKRKREVPENYLNPEFLNDDFEIENIREGEFREIIQELSDNTFTEIINPARFVIFSLLGCRNIKTQSFRVAILDPDYCNHRILIPQTTKDVYFSKEQHTLGNVSIQELKRIGMTDKQIDEVEEAGFFLQYRTEEGTLTLIPSKTLLSTLSRQLGIGKLNEGIDFFRNLYLASLMRDADDFALVYRKSHSGFAKAFGCFSPKFVATPQTVVFQLMDRLSNLKTLEGGHLTVRKWRVTHSMTVIEFHLNELMETICDIKITPGVRFILSDIGDSSYILQNALYLNGGTVLLDESVSKSHNGVLDINQMVKTYEKKQFPALRKIMKNMKDLESKPINDKREAMVTLMKAVSFSAAFGVNNAAAFKKEFLPKKGETCNALQLLIELLQIPGIIHTQYKTDVVDRVSTAIGKILTLNLKKVLKW